MNTVEEREREQRYHEHNRRESEREDTEIMNTKGGVNAQIP